MPRPIVKLEGKYLVWSTISDGPASWGMTREELIDYFQKEYGNQGVYELGPRLERVDEKGTSSHDDEDADDTVWLNRAGPREKPLHREEIIEFYIRRPGTLTQKTLDKFREGLARCGPSCVAIERNGCADWCRKCWGTGYVRPSTEGPSDTKGEET